MRIFSQSTLAEFWSKHRDAEQPLRTWYKIACKADWRGPNDVKAMFIKASIIGDNRVVFNIVGGSYRLVVKFAYDRGWGFVRFIGTHAEYDKIDCETI